jgi:ActR/RegA family two-component response regulator
MSLRALLVSRDADAVSVLQTVMHDLDVESEVCADLEPAVERLAQGVTTAVVVDYDVEHATELLKLTRQNYADSCVALAMVKGLTSIQAAYDMGVKFVLMKPVSADAASRSLGQAAALMERMQHRPARLVVPTLAYVSFADALDPAIILDISEGGMAIQALQAVQADGPLRLQFDLPGSADTMSLPAEIVWADSSGRAGLRFIDLSEDNRQRLRDWVRVNGERLWTATKLTDHPPAPIRTSLGDAGWEVKVWPEPATVAQRIFSTLIDAAIVLLGSLIFFGVFLAWAHHLPTTPWAWLIALLVPCAFWGVYLYLFLAHPRGTPGMQMAENGTAAADRPEMFDLVPPSPLISASSRILTWMKARSAGAPKRDADDDALATVPSSAAEPVRRENGLSHS